MDKSRTVSVLNSLPSRCGQIYILDILATYFLIYFKEHFNCCEHARTDYRARNRSINWQIGRFQIVDFF